VFFKKLNVMDELVVVKASDFEADLVIAQSYLLDNGIDCVINKGYITISMPDRGSATLEVRSEDYQRAMDLLIKGGFIEEEN